MTNVLFDAGTSFSASTATTAGGTHTLTSATDNCMFSTSSNTATAGDLVTGCTWAAAAMTQEALNGSGTTAGCFTRIYSKLSPATGAQTLTLTASGNSNLVLFGASMTNVNQTTPISATGGSDNPTTPASPTDDAISVNSGGMALNVMILRITAAAPAITIAGSPSAPTSVAVHKAFSFVSDTVCGYQLNGTRAGGSWTGTGIHTTQSIGAVNPSAAAGGGFFARYYYEMGQSNV